MSTTQISPPPMQILKTKDYGIFKFIMSNREVDVNHVRKLAKSIQRNNLLYIRPLIVNDKMQVIDGQHRLEAAKSIGAEVYYLKVDKLTKSDIGVLNSAQKNWTRADFVNFFAMEGNDHYKQLAKLIDHYYWLNASIIIRIAGGENYKDIKEGGFKMKDTKRPYIVLEWLRKLEGKFDFITNSGFAQAFNSKITTQRAFDILSKGITAKPFEKCKASSQYAEVIDSILKS